MYYFLYVLLINIIIILLFLLQKALIFELEVLPVY